MSKSNKNTVIVMAIKPKYAGDKLVTALRVTDTAQFNVSFDGKPPLNWGRFTKVSRVPATNPTESEVAK